MIKVVAKNIIKADKVSEFISLGKKLVEETNKNDKGCLSYELYQDTDNPQILTMIEEWESTEALNNHMAAKHFQDIIPQLGELSENPGEINTYKKV
ncbi:MAG: antibiotic biosynthesis monooxygenase [Clostridiales bacterium]|nr:antibiotic biosynthesis monooxygenase [Clostridiales bacterium]